MESAKDLWWWSNRKREASNTPPTSTTTSHVSSKDGSRVRTTSASERVRDFKGLIRDICVYETDADQTDGRMVIGQDSGRNE